MTSDNTAVEPSEHDGLSRRRALGYGGAIVAGAAASQLIVDGAAAAGGRGSDEMRTISLAQANRIIAAGVQHVKRNDLPPMFILVVDACGDEKASRRMDGNGPASVALVPAKARTALAFRQPTARFAQGVTDPGRIASFVAAGFSLLGGGRPIMEGDMVIGAIGVGGGSPEQDDEVAAAALEAL
jgi:uncharacterized protein GlcG (DUF336 family)